MKILIITDTWVPNINGVVTTLFETKKCLERLGHEVYVIEPSLFKTIPLPNYPEVRLSINVWNVPKMIKDFNPDYIHLATEGPIGIAGRIYCGSNDIPFSSSYHSKFPEYIHQYTKIPTSFTYSLIRNFHSHTNNVLVTTPSMKNELIDNGFDGSKITIWNRGVDRNIFNSVNRLKTWCEAAYHDDTLPVLLYVGRVCKEKGLEDFCSMEIPSHKIIVGDGPYRKYLQAKYPDVQFVGYKHGTELANYYATADCFVFPSQTDTFGIVMLESIACGTPIAAYPVTGPIDVVEQDINGSVDWNLKKAVKEALNCNRLDVEISSEKYDWQLCTETFFNALVRIDK